MITRTDFLQILEEYEAQSERLDVLDDINLRIWDSPLIEYGNRMFERVITAYFTEEGAEWIFWWIYDKNGRSNMIAKDRDNKEIPMETKEELWAFVRQFTK